MENKQECDYFLKYKENDRRIFSLTGSLYCDKLNCENQDGPRFSYEADGNLVRECGIGESLLEPETSDLNSSISRIIGGVIIHKQNKKTSKYKLIK